MNPYGVEIQVSLGGLIKNKDLWRQYVAICKRNNRTVTEDLEAFIADTVKNHETGNDQFKIDQWVDNYDMKAVPALFSDNKIWKEYANKLTKREFNDLEKKVMEITSVIEQSYKDMEDTRKGVRYG